MAQSVAVGPATVLPDITGLNWRRPALLARNLALAFVTFAIVLLLLGRNPLVAYAAIVRGALGSGYGLSEVAVKLIPFLLCALATTIPARVGLVNVGADGQMYMGAWLASYAALNLSQLSGWEIVPIMIVTGFAGGALWAGIAGLLRVRAGLNETIATLLLNYVASLIVDHFVHGPWREKSPLNWPYTAQFSNAARLPSFFGTRIHLGIVLAIVALAATLFILKRTRWGFDVRVVGGNPEAARRSGIPISRYLIVAMAIGGGLAGLAGMGEVSAIQGRLRSGLSNGYGYIGFLASWLAGHNPLWSVGSAFLLAVVYVGGDVLQVNVNVPASAANVLTGLILFFVLALQTRKAARA
ncbi:MAG TPA: ABC transporter permease [Chloroflexota bacterium]|nr:ABC transporter permease [Chloroflexota bacterium]